MGFLLKLLDGPLVDTTALVNQMTSGGGLARVDVADDDDVDMDLFLSHLGLEKDVRHNSERNPDEFYNGIAVNDFSSNHFLKQFIDLVLSASEVTTLHEVIDLLPPAAGGSVQLERPKKVGSVLEVGTNVEDLVNQILDTDDPELAELILDDVIRCNGSAVAVNLPQETFILDLV